MNIWIFSSGLLGLFTALVHIFAGQIDPVRPFLRSDLDLVPKATLLACWHLVSVILLASSVMLIYAGWNGNESFDPLIWLIGSLYILFALVFIATGWYFFAGRCFVKLPQWLLLLPIGVLSVYGVTSV